MTKRSEASLHYKEQLPSPLFAEDMRLGGTLRHWLRPIFLSPYRQSDKNAAPLSNSGLGFAGFDVVVRARREFSITRMNIAEAMASAKKGGADALMLAEQHFAHLTAPRPDFAGLTLNTPRIMGIVNTTPDSFSDGGDFLNPEHAIAGGLAMTAADILDIGGESTRPGAEAVDAASEAARILPVISALAEQGRLVSADTRRARVMAQALKSGATIINDVSGLGDSEAAAVLAKHSAPVVLMHKQGEPKTMQDAPHYDFVPTDVYDWLEMRLETALRAGIPRANIAIDIGFGFGKTPRHNMMLMAWLSLFHGLGVPLLLGVSRKSTIAHFSDNEPPKDRLSGSLALATLGYAQGVQMFRVHDVAETAQSLKLASAMRHYADG